MNSEIRKLEASALDSYRRGNLTQAETQCKQILQVFPDNFQAILLLGLVAAKSRRIPEAISLLVRALQIDDRSFDAHVWLSNLYRMTHATDLALEHALKANSIDSTNPAAMAALGLAYIGTGQCDEAITTFSAAVRVEPRSAPLHHNLARAYQLAGQLESAVRFYGRAADLAPANPESWISKSQVLFEMGDRARAVDALKKAHSLEPNTPRGILQLAKAEIQEGRIDQAEQSLRKVIEGDPGSAAAYGLLGNVLQQQGRFEEAIPFLQEAIRQQPVVARPYFDLVYCKKIGEADRDLIDQMEALVSSYTAQPENGRHLHYALGKAYSDQKRFDTAISHYDHANECMDRLNRVPYDPDVHAEEVSRRIQIFSPHLFQTSSNTRNPTEKPIFIIGMIRSGTTLLEQILSSHPDVMGAGELLFWQEKASEVLSASRNDIDIRKVERLAKDYLKQLESLSVGTSHVTDKMPLNFLHVGILHLAFPNARFVHCRRNPLDTALSMYLTPFPSPVNFAHNKARIVGYYREYLRLMEHWRRVLPEDRLLEVDYECVVSDRGQETRRMIEFLGLPWDDRCQNPEKNQRVVRTPSMWQVRQPIYRSSVGRWHDYEPWLGPLAELKDVSD